LQYADAADVSQLVLSKVSEAIRGFDYAPERGRFRGWLGTITANEVKTFQARQGRLGPVLEEADSTPHDPDPLWNAEFIDHVLAVALDRIRAEFTSTTWAAFEAAWVRQEAPSDIAANLGIAIHAVYVNKSRVLHRLEKEVLLLAEDFPFSDTNARRDHETRV
jgi:RNA polymerase sigma-70 factor (ECF subfamily)